MTAVGGQTVIPIPIIRQFDRAFLLPLGCHENQGKPALFVVRAAGLFQTQQAVEFHRSVQVFDPDHGVEIAKGHNILLSWFAKRLGQFTRMSRVKAGSEGRPDAQLYAEILGLVEVDIGVRAFRVERDRWNESVEIHLGQRGRHGGLNAAFIAPVGCQA